MATKDSCWKILSSRIKSKGKRNWLKKTDKLLFKYGSLCVALNKWTPKNQSLSNDFLIFWFSGLNSNMKLNSILEGFENIGLLLYVVKMTAVKKRLSLLSLVWWIENRSNQSTGILLSEFSVAWKRKWSQVMAGNLCCVKGCTTVVQN